MVRAPFSKCTWYMSCFDDPKPSDSTFIHTRPVNQSGLTSRCPSEPKMFDFFISCPVSWS